MAEPDYNRRNPYDKPRSADQMYLDVLTGKDDGEPDETEMIEDYQEPFSLPDGPMYPEPAPPPELFGQSEGTAPTTPQQMAAKGEIPLDAGRLADKSAFSNANYSDVVEETMRNGDAKPIIDMVLIPVESLSDSQIDPDVLQRTGKRGKLNNDLLAIPPNKTYSWAPTTGTYDPISKEGHRNVAAREQYLKIVKSSDSGRIAPGVWGDIEPWPSAVLALALPAADPACYTIAGPSPYAGTWRRITFPIELIIHAPALIVLVKANRVAFPPFTGTYYITVNDELDHQQKISVDTLQTKPSFEASFGEEKQLSRMKISNLTIHTAFQLSDLKVTILAYS